MKSRCTRRSRKALGLEPASIGGFEVPVNGMRRVVTWMLVGWLVVLIPAIQASPTRAQSTLPNLDTSPDDKPGKSAQKSAPKVIADDTETGVPEGVNQLFVRLQQAARNGQGDAVLALLDVNAMVDSLIDRGIVEVSGPQFRKGFLKGLLEGMETKADILAKSFTLDRLRFLTHERLDEQGGDPKVAVTTRSIDRDLGITVYMKWWLVQADDEWRLYDFQDIGTGLRWSTATGSLAAAAQQEKEWVAPFLEFASMQQAIKTGQSLDVEGIFETSARLLESEMPADCRAYVLIVRSGVAQMLDDFDEAMAADLLIDLDELRELDLDTPMESYVRGTLLVELEQYEDAIASFEKYAERLAWDADVCESVADAWAALDDDAKAVEYALRGLNDNADSVGCLMTLAVALPADRKSEMDAWLQRYGFAESVLESVIDWCLANDDTMGALHGFKHLRRHHPDSYLIDYYNKVMNITDY